MTGELRQQRNSMEQASAEAIAKLTLEQRWAIARARAERTLERTRDFDPDQPRDDEGKWTSGGGDGGGGGGDGGGKKPPGSKHPGAGYSKDAYEKDGVIHTSNVNDAARALHENRKVELNQPRKVSVLINRLGKIAQGMIAKGKEAPVFNLCNVTVTGTSLFCAESKGIPRVQMPQLDDQQTKDFRKYLKEQGYKVEKESTPASHLRATQNELNGAKIAGIAGKLKDKPDHYSKRIIVSKDDYILDGHHHWGAKIGLDAADGNLTNDTKVKISRVNISITKLLEEAEKFTGGKGKKPASESGTSKQLASKILAALFDDELRDYDESEHPRDEHGRWTDGGGGGDDGGGGDGGGTGAASKESASALYQPPKATHDEIVARVPGARERIAMADRLMAQSAPTSAPVSKGGYRNDDGSWTIERTAMHRSIIAEVMSPQAMADATPKPGEKPVLHFIGGRGGSGKSWFTDLKKGGTIDNKKNLYLNADDFMKKLPEYAGWNAGLLYDESGIVGQTIEKLARERGVNVTIDGTMKNAEQTRDRIEKFKAAGYEIVGHYMYASPEIAAERALSRFAERDKEGRYVQIDYILESTTNEKNFDAMREHMKSWEVYDNNVNGRAPKFHARG